MAASAIGRFWRKATALISTQMSYQLIARDLDRSIQRIETQPMVQRETDYFRENIGKITSIDDFLDDTRLFNYAMKAHGLQDMSYAKALMRKALEEGIEEPDSFANRMTDKRYADFVRTFNFVEYGASATTYNAAVEESASRFAERALSQGLPHEAIADDLAKFREAIVEITSIDELFGNEHLLPFVAYAFELEDYADRLDLLKDVLAGGVDDPENLAHTLDEGKLLDFAAAFDFNKYGEATTTHTPEKAAIEKYMRQTLEEDAGAQNEGVRLALYFERKIDSITTPYQILADPALAQVVRTALGLPDSIAQANIDRQADLIRDRLDLEQLQDPDELARFITRFTTMWEINNGASGAGSPLLQLFQPTQASISPDLLFSFAQVKR